MPMDRTEIEQLIKAKFPDAQIDIRDLRRRRPLRRPVVARL